MSDNYTETPDDRDADDFKLLRAKAKKADEYEREMTTLKRELAFVKAGVPMDDPKMNYFVKGYEGELDPVAIRQAAIDAGFMAPPQQQTDHAVQQAQQGQAAVMAASSGVQPEFDLSSGLYALEQAYNEGGVEGMLAVAQQYGIRTSEYDD